MHEPVMSISILITFRSRPFALFANLENTGRCFSKRTVIKNSSMRWRKTRPTVQHKSNCAACFLYYRITCWWDDGSLSLNNAIRIGCMWLRSNARQAMQVNNIIVILESVINYDHAIMIIKQANVILHLEEVVAFWIYKINLSKIQFKLKSVNCKDMWTENEFEIL